MLRRRAVFTALGGAALSVLAGHARAQAMPVRLGVLLPGDDAPTAALTRHAAEIATDIVARRGRHITLRFAQPHPDDDDDVQRSAQRLIDDGAEALLSSCSDAASFAASRVAERRGVPVIIASASAPGLTDHGARMLVRTAPTTSQLVGRGLGLLRDLHAIHGVPLPERIVLLHTDSKESTPLRLSLAAVLPAADLPLKAYTEIACAPVPDTPAILKRLRAAAADLILLEAGADASAVLIQAIMSNGLHTAGIIGFGLPGLAAPAVLALPARSSNYHLTLAPWPDPRSPITGEVRSLFARRNPPVQFERVQGELGMIVDPVLLLGEALAHQPGARGPALAAALRTTVLSQKMMRGPPMRLDARGQNTALPSVALQNRLGRPVVVLPHALAEAPPVWPNPRLAKS